MKQLKTQKTINKTNNMQNLLFILGLITLMLIGWCVYKEISYKNFQQNMKNGDKCFFYVGEIRYFGIISEIKNDVVVCKNAYNSFSVLRSNVNPV